MQTEPFYTTPCFTPEDDNKLARGWPYLIAPMDAPMTDKRAAQSAQKAWMVCDPIHFTEWPRPTLNRFVHAAIETLFVAGPTPQVFEKKEAPSADEALDGLRRLFRAGYDTYRFKEAELTYGVEAIAGTDATLALISDEIEQFEVPRTNPGFNHDCRASIAQAAYFMLLRASPAVAKKARAAMGKTFAEPRAASVAETYKNFFAALDYALHGAAAVKSRIGRWISMDLWQILGVDASLDFAADDPAWVREMITKADAKSPMSVRVASIAGPPALEGLSARKWPARQLPSIVRDFGMLRDPQIVAFMLSLVGKTSVKDAPLQWFRAHAEYAKPLLAKSKSDTAQSVLRQL